MTPIRLVATSSELAELLRDIEGEPSIAIDTEAASFHRYHDRIYLIQISTPDWTAVVDPLGVGDLAGIGALLANPDVENVFHDAAYDLRLFDHQFGYHAHALFDTRIAAQFLNEPGIGLGALLEKYFGVKTDKRFQRADWSARPLSVAMLEYAAGDTTYLYKLQLLLRQRLVEVGRLAWVIEECDRLEAIRWTATNDPATDFLRMKGARALDRRGLAILSELYQWRAALAAEIDRAEFRIAGNEVLLQLSANPTGSIDELSRTKGIGRETLERQGSAIMAAIARGAQLPDDAVPRLPRPARRPIDPAYEARLEMLKHARNRLGQELELAPGVLCPNGTLESIARLDPDDVNALGSVTELRRWQIETIGEELLAAMHRTRSVIAIPGEQP